MTHPFADRLPPHDRDAERGVLGGVLRDPDVLPDVRDLVRPEAFYFDAHQKVFRALCDLAGAGRPIDLVLLHDRLRQANHLADAGGVAYLTELWEAAPTGANAAYHARLVRDAATLRGLIHATGEILRDAYSPTMPADELLATAERRLYALSADLGDAGGGVRHVGEVMREVLAALDDRIAAGGSFAGTATGYPDLDAVLCGLRPGELVVLGARPSVGKTALALCVADRVAGAGEPVLFFSLEMRAEDIAARLLAMESGVSMHRLSRPRDLRPDDIEALVRAGSPDGAGGAPVYIDDTPDQSAARVAAVARRAARKHGCGLVVVDYLQLMRPENPRDNRTQQVGTLALRMKQLARDLGVPLVLLSQLNRESEHGNRRPRLSDLRESGDIEAHADRVLLLHREANLSNDDPVWPVEVIVAKNRNGPVGDLRLCYRRPVLRFENAAYEERRGAA